MYVYVYIYKCIEETAPDAESARRLSPRALLARRGPAAKKEREHEEETVRVSTQAARTESERERARTREREREREK